MTEGDPWAESELVWHYTNVAGAVGIQKTGAIKCHDLRLKESKLPIIWFSDRPTWEPTASRVFRGLDMPNFRFGARRVMTTAWPKLAVEAGMSWSCRKFLEKTGRAGGANPSFWCGAVAYYYDVGSLIPQIEDDDGWGPVDLADLVRRIDDVVEFKSESILSPKGQFRATRILMTPRSAA